MKRIGLKHNSRTQARPDERVDYTTITTRWNYVGYTHEIMLSSLLLYIYHSFAITHCCYYYYHRGTKNHHYQVQLMTQALHNKVVKSYKIRHPFRMVSTHFHPYFIRLDSDVLEFLSGFLRVNLLILLVV